MLHIHASTGNQKQIDFQEGLPAGLRRQAQQDTRELLTQIRRQISLSKQTAALLSSSPSLAGGEHGYTVLSLLGPRLQLLHRQVLPGRVQLGFPPLPPALRISSASSAWKGSITQLASFGSRHTHLFPTYGLCPPCMHFGWCELSRLMAFPEHSARGPHCQDPLHPAGLTWPLTTSDFSSPVHLLGVKLCTFKPVCV